MDSQRARVSLRDLVGGLRREYAGTVDSMVPTRGFGSAMAPITTDDAMRHSAVWSALRVRANLISSLDITCYRSIVDPTGDKLKLQVNPPPVLVEPSPGVYLPEWLYSSQVDLDRYGNTFGLIRQRDSLGLPMRIDLVPAGDVRVRLSKSGDVSYRVGNKVYESYVVAGKWYCDVWHERQYTVAGMPVGLSPIAYAASTIQQHKSAQQFSIAWYTNNAVPAGHLKNTGKRLNSDEARLTKDRFKAAMQGGGDVFVTGNDWEFSPIVAESNDQVWLSSMNASDADVARFFDVPADIIGAASGPGSSITYANITQRFLQLLTVHLGPTLKRRRNAFTNGLMSKPRFCEFQTEQLLAMDPAALSTMLGQQIRDQIRTPNEVRNQFYNLPDLEAAPAVAPAVPALTDGSTTP